jgi:hypothetical protein
MQPDRRVLQPPRCKGTGTADFVALVG